MKLRTHFALLGTLLIALSLSGCGQNAADDPAEEPMAQIANPMVAYEDADFTAEAGFAIVGYPDDDTFTPTAFYLIGGTLGEIRYGETLTLRAAEGSEDISGIYGDPVTVDTTLTVPFEILAYNDPCQRIGEEPEAYPALYSTTVEIPVTVKTYSDYTVALWQNGEYSFSLLIRQATDLDHSAIIQTFVSSVSLKVANCE